MSNTKLGTKLQRIQAAAALIRLAENVHRDVALAWAWQAWREYEAKQVADSELTTLFSSLTDQVEPGPVDPVKLEVRRLRQEERRHKKAEAGAFPKSWAVLEARAAYLGSNPAAKKRARVCGPRIYSGAPKSASQRAVARRQKAEAALPPLLSAEESRRLYGARRKAIQPVSASKAPARLGAEPKIAV